MVDFIFKLEISKVKRTKMMNYCICIVLFVLILLQPMVGGQLSEQNENIVMTT